MKKASKTTAKANAKHAANAQWLGERAGERREAEARVKPVYATFAEYVAAHPDGERWRKWVEDGSLVPGYGGASCLPGDYYVVQIREWPVRARKPDGSLDYARRNENLGTEIWVTVNDGDDGFCSKRCADRAAALAEVEALKDLAPFYYGDLREFGYGDFN